MWDEKTGKKISDLRFRIYIRHQEINSMYSNLYGIELKDSYLCYVMPITDNQAAGIDWYHSGFDDEELGFAENQIHLSYGYNIMRKLSLGANVKYLNRDMNLDGISVDSFSRQRQISRRGREKVNQ